MNKITAFQMPIIDALNGSTTLPTPLNLKARWTPDEIRSRLPEEGGLGFLFHATDPQSVSIGNEGAWTEQQLWEAKPFIASPIFFENRVIGAHLIMPPHVAMWANGHSGIGKFRQKQYIPALKLAEQCGINWLGLAALVPFATDFGRWGSEHRKPFATTGHAATVAAIRWQVKALSEELDFSPEGMTYAIFGAAGSIGSNCARWFMETGLGKLVLIERRQRATQTQALAAELRSSVNCHSISCCFTDELTSLPEFQVGIVATSAATPWIDVTLLKRAAIWIDDSHPRAASAEVEESLADSVIYAECFLRGPHGLSQTFPFPLPTPRDCYACFSEVFLCWHAKMKRDFVIGPATLEQIAYVDKLLHEFGFEVGPLTQKSGKPVSKQTLEHVKKILAR